MHTLKKTPSENTIPLRGEFPTLVEALDYAAEGQTGINFYSGKGELAVALPYALLRSRARSLARKLLSLGLPGGAEWHWLPKPMPISCSPSLPVSMPDWFRCRFPPGFSWEAARQ